MYPVFLPPDFRDLFLMCPGICPACDQPGYWDLSLKLPFQCLPFNHHGNTSDDEAHCRTRAQS